MEAFGSESIAGLWSPCDPILMSAPADTVSVSRVQSLNGKASKTPSSKWLSEQSVWHITGLIPLGFILAGIGQKVLELCYSWGIGSPPWVPRRGWIAMRHII